VREIISTQQEWQPGKKILSVLGPTASGKTALALSLADACVEKGLKPAILVSVDAVAVYQKLDIGSAKPSGAERENYQWLGLDLVSCGERLTASDYLKVLKEDVLKALEACHPVIFVGGSFFYERMLVDGPAPGAASDESYLQQLMAQKLEEVFEQLRKKEPDIGEWIHPNDEYRVHRYADLILRQGLSLADLKNSNNAPFDSDTQTLVLNATKVAPDSHYLTRIDQMFESGWIEEVKNLRKEFSDESWGLKTIGYEQVVRHLAGQTSFEECRQEVLIAHRQLAKKQRTWLRGLSSRFQDTF